MKTVKQNNRMQRGEKSEKFSQLRMVGYKKPKSQHNIFLPWKYLRHRFLAIPAKAEIQVSELGYWIPCQARNNDIFMS